MQANFFLIFSSGSLQLLITACPLAPLEMPLSKSSLGKASSLKLATLFHQYVMKTFIGSLPPMTLTLLQLLLRPHCLFTGFFHNKTQTFQAPSLLGMWQEGSLYAILPKSLHQTQDSLPQMQKRLPLGQRLQVGSLYIQQTVFKLQAGQPSALLVRGNPPPYPLDPAHLWPLTTNDHQG